MSGGNGGGAGAVVRQGHLRKLKTMKKKYFVLRAETVDCSARLEYYESEKKFRAGAAPRRVLPLKSCYNIMRRLDLKQKHVIALFTREEQFCIVAENETELHAWLTAILKQHRSDDASDELLHPIQHVWQVNVQKKGLGATKNIQGLYNLCLTDKTLTLVKIKSHNNVISDLGIPERVEYSLKNIRRCGDSECFFYLDVGRQTSTGGGELWMHTEDSNIAQSMHSTIYHAMRNCAREIENERDHIVLPAGDQPLRIRSNSEVKPKVGLSDAGRIRCDSMPSRPSSTFESERPQTGHRFNELEAGPETSRDETDAKPEWYSTPRIPEEPDCCDMNPSLLSGSSVGHSRTSSVGEGGAYLAMAPGEAPGGLASASSGSLCSGTPSTDPRFSEYQLEPATSHFALEARPPRAYSVGSRPAPTGGNTGGNMGGNVGETRHRAYSVGARHRPPAHRPRAVTEDHMEIDFSYNSPANRVSSLARTPPPANYNERPKASVDEYVDMSPRNAGYVEMKPGEPPATPSTTDGYVEMNYGRAATRPIAIGTGRPDRVTRISAAASPEEPKKRLTPHGSQTLFDMSLDSPADSQDATRATPPVDLTPLEDEPPHPLTTVRELSEDGRKSPDIPASPQYVTLAPRRDERKELAGNPTAAKTISRLPDLVDSKGETLPTATLVVAAEGGAARFSLEHSPPASPIAASHTAASPTAASPTAASPTAASPTAASPTSASPTAAPPLNYAALDLEPRKASTQPTHRAYTQIDFIRSEKLHADVT